MIAKLSSCSIKGIDGFIVDVEVDIAYGMPVFNIVGLPEASIKESKDRVKTAINNSGYTFPMERLIVNLAPADVKKEGTGFDLPVAIGILMASKVISSDKIKDYIILGELSLDGKIKPIKAVLSYALTAKQNGYKGIIIPFANANEASMVKGIDVLPVKTLSEIVDFFAGFIKIKKHEFNPDKILRTAKPKNNMDFSQVKGQTLIKRALEVAASGFHNVLMTGPPGSGKSMMAKRLSTIMPALTFKEAIEVTRLYSVMGMIGNDIPYMQERPFRSPHHTISDAGLVGGGSNPLPGEISLAHNGVLFLDELPEFKKNVLEVLRQPIEDKQVTIARAGTKATYPSNFMLVAAMNPCPCGYLSDPLGKCTCTHPQIRKYRSKISGPLLDRIAIQIEVPKVKYADLETNNDSETSLKIQKRVNKVRKIQRDREKDNIQSNNQGLPEFWELDTNCKQILKKAVDILGFSVRACNLVIKTARTIADIEDSVKIKSDHIAEAIQYRSFDRLL